MSCKEFAVVNLQLKFLERLYAAAKKLRLSEEFINAIVKETHRIGANYGLYKTVEVKNGSLYEIR